MALLLTFVALALGGQITNVAVFLAVEGAYYSGPWLLPSFFVAAMAVFWLAWRLALWVTAPRLASAESHILPRRTSS